MTVLCLRVAIRWQFLIFGNKTLIVHVRPHNCLILELTLNDISKDTILKDIFYAGSVPVSCSSKPTCWLFSDIDQILFINETHGMDAPL